MNTVIFKWNPSFSSYSMVSFLRDISDLNREYLTGFDWSVWDHDKIHVGDRFYWVKVGMYGQTGIVGCGKITSEPYTGRDWSGQGRKTYYVDFEPEILVNPDTLPILSCAELQRAIPDFQWNGGHSGLVLTPGQAVELDCLWEKYLRANSQSFEKAFALERGSKDLIYSKAYCEAHREPEEEHEPSPEEIKRKQYFDKVRADAEQGIFAEDTRNLIDGFDLINGRIGNFRGCEILHFEVDYPEDFIRIKIHLEDTDKGIDSLLELRFEGEIQHDLCFDEVRYPGFGYFYRDVDHVYLTFNEYVELGALKIKVVSLTPRTQQCPPAADNG